MTMLLQQLIISPLWITVMEIDYYYISYFKYKYVVKHKSAKLLMTYVQIQAVRELDRVSLLELVRVN